VKVAAAVAAAAVAARLRAALVVLAARVATPLEDLAG
jgi:hypothetical protein